MNTKWLVALGTVAVAISAFAQWAPIPQESNKGKAAKDPVQTFRSLDSNGDGTLSRQEFGTIGPSGTFTGVDANADKQVSKAEFRVAMPPVRPRVRPLMNSKPDGTSE